MLLRYIKYLLIILFSVVLLQCGGVGGTDTGNPDSNNNDTGTEVVSDNDTITNESNSDHNKHVVISSGSDPIVDENDIVTTLFHRDDLSEDVINLVCEIAVFCDEGLDYDTCQDQLWTDKNLMNAFGASTVFYNTFNRIQSDIDNETIEAPRDIINSCNASIRDFSCADLERIGTFSAGYRNLYFMVPSECLSLFE